MQLETDRFFILTGGPGAGKTTLIEALAAAGHARSFEAGRGVIQDQMAIDGPALPWRDPLAFAELMLAWDMRSHHLAASESGLVFFDRGIPDVLGYLHLLGRPAPAHMLRAAERFRYNGRVFIVPPWPEIFTPDRERRQDFDEAVRTDRAMRDVYGTLGYDLIEVPRAGPAERAAFVAERAAALAEGRR